MSENVLGMRLNLLSRLEQALIVIDTKQDERRAQFLTEEIDKLLSVNVEAERRKVTQRKHGPNEIKQCEPDCTGCSFERETGGHHDDAPY